MPHFPGYYLSSRQTLENLFVRFERTYIGVVFDTKISAGNHYVFAGERLKNSKNSTFLETPFGRHGLKDWLRVMKFPAMAIKALKNEKCLLCLLFLDAVTGLLQIFGSF